MQFILLLQLLILISLVHKFTNACFYYIVLYFYYTILWLYNISLIKQVFKLKPNRGELRREVPGGISPQGSLEAPLLVKVYKSN